MSHPTKVADADESRRQHVQQESAQEFLDRQRHQTLLIVVSGIAPAKGDGAVGERDEAMVRDRYTVDRVTEFRRPRSELHDAHVLRLTRVSYRRPDLAGKFSRPRLIVAHLDSFS